MAAIPQTAFSNTFSWMKIWISINISLKFVPNGQNNNILALVQIMAWRRPGDKPLSEAMMIRLPTHICVTQPQWINHHQMVSNCSTFIGIIMTRHHLICWATIHWIPDQYNCFNFGCRNGMNFQVWMTDLKDQSPHIKYSISHGICTQFSYALFFYSCSLGLLHRHWGNRTGAIAWLPQCQWSDPEGY